MSGEGGAGLLFFLDLCGCFLGDFLVFGMDSDLFEESMLSNRKLQDPLPKFLR